MAGPVTEFFSPIRLDCGVLAVQKRSGLVKPQSAVAPSCKTGSHGDLGTDPTYCGNLEIWNPKTSKKKYQNQNPFAQNIRRVAISKDSRPFWGPFQTVSTMGGKHIFFAVFVYSQYFP